MAELFVVFMLLFSSAPFAKADKESPKTKPTSSTEKKIVCLGDSITEGYGVTKDEAFPNLLQKELNDAKYKVTVVNAGISGSTSASGPGRLNWLLKSKPDLLLIELGANDGLRGQSIDATKKNLVTMIQAAKAANVKPILIGMKLPPNFGEDYRKKFEQAFVSVAKSQNIKLIPFFEDFFAKPGLLQGDGLHPNAKGHSLIAKELSKILSKEL